MCTRRRTHTPLAYIHTQTCTHPHAHTRAQWVEVKTFFFVFFSAYPKQIAHDFNVQRSMTSFFCEDACKHRYTYTQTHTNTHAQACTGKHRDAQNCVYGPFSFNSDWKWQLNKGLIQHTLAPLLSLLAALRSFKLRQGALSLVRLIPAHFCVPNEVCSVFKVPILRFFNYV